MIKARMVTGRGEPVLFLGLSGENVTRLVAGEPVHVTADALSEMGLPHLAVVIHYGKTEQAILDEIQSHGVPMRFTTPEGS
ncbi:MAG TPA: hypothetical protein VK586_02520 [Streptosporangiaceae bacterium]|nr:hypothetical protein [Streptosporangiaceae bacterium]